MKYATKTAIEIMTEEDRLEAIPFLESLGGVNVHHVSNDNIDIGEIWYISTDNNKIVLNKYVDLQYNNYTILKGVPQNWREESEPTEPSKLDQLESENNEMRDSLKSILDMYETDNRDANDWYDLMYKAKQLLEK